jgi:hypothetical protein
MTEKDKETILEEARKVRDSDDVEYIRSVVCKFYRDGGCPELDDPNVCNGCKEDESVLNCKASYLTKIFYRPQKVWTPEFDVPVQRDKVKLREDSTVNQIGTYCDHCYIKSKCPQYKRGHQCGIDWSEDVSGLSSAEMMDRLIALQQERINKAKTFEALDGGVPDATLSLEMDRMSGLIQAKANLNTFKFGISATMSAPTEGGQKQGGLLSSLLGGMLGGGQTQQALPEASKRETIELKQEVEEVSYEEDRGK